MSPLWVPSWHMRAARDDALINISTCELMEELGCSVSGYMHSADAIAAANRELPDVAVLDINLHDRETSYGFADGYNLPLPKHPLSIVWPRQQSGVNHVRCGTGTSKKAALAIASFVEAPMSKKAALCARAAECERRAEEMPDALFREIFLDLARQWRRVAEEFDDASEQELMRQHRAGQLSICSGSQQRSSGE